MNRNEWELARQEDDAEYAHIFETKPARYYQVLHPKSHWKRMVLPVGGALALLGLSVYAAASSNFDLALTTGVFFLLSLPLVWFIRLRSLWIFNEHRLEADPVSGQVYIHQWGSKKLFVPDSAPDLKSLRRYDVDTAKRTFWEQYIWPFKGSQTLVLTPFGTTPPKRLSWFDRYVRDMKPEQTSAIVINDVVDAELIVEIAQWHDIQPITLQQQTRLEQVDGNTEARETNRLLRKMVGEPPVDDSQPPTRPGDESGRWNAVRGQYRHR